MSSVPPTPVTKPEDPSLGELIKQLSQDSTRLIRDELKLAQAEASEKAKGLGVGVGAFGAAGVLALFGFGVLIATAILGLALVLPAWLASLIVGVAILVIAGIAALIGKKKISEGAPPVPTDTIAGAKADIDQIKESAKR